ncbi:hypothetical protein CCC_00157 [Paramagnetospirillum magnetotacticum MS-1]|uniref:Uncharacterized protein n=1 Tax=Paramagnetospirillum magnetotacticum MS-1 TaxID=272627 RepID=A0A0C2UWC4_PARME|nr:hypothetical protein [Paramagnetospirillum magnetotacticum]KIL97096.1 hypothetical protein CCC_00157 [Paramagnetospirillum magnetotacticum MS-1]
MKVAAISFNDNHSLSMDVEGVRSIGAAQPLELEDGSWFMELLIRTGNGTVALQLVAESRDKLDIIRYE